MIILGIDPGSRCLGFGVIQINARKVKYVASGCLVLKGELAQRLLTIDQELTSIVRRYEPEVAALESVFMHRYAKSALTLGHARGVAMVALARQHLSIQSYAPREIKQAVVGYGGADKQQVQHMMQALLQLSGLPQADAADALAAAYCHAMLGAMVLG